MKLEYKIQKGWRKLMVGALLTDHDLFPDTRTMVWCRAYDTGFRVEKGETYIRKIKPRRKKAIIETLGGEKK